MPSRKHPLWLTIILATFLMWDYPADPDLAMFLIFVRGEGQSYDWDSPLVPVDVVSDGLVREVNCQTLPLLTPGPWYAVVTAMPLRGEMSGPSNELRFYWTRQDGCTATAPGPPVKPSPPVPVAPTPPAAGVPPDLGRQFPPVVVTIPKAPPRAASTGDGLADLTESCAWRGCQAPPPPPMKDPGPPLTELPQWRGAR